MLLIKFHLMLTVPCFALYITEHITLKYLFFCDMTPYHWVSGS